jgi:predicted  nucleic acid-binding Zn-ribbon protein
MMLETVKHKITRLIAAYEKEKSERTIAQKELEQLKAQNETYRKQILELERQIDNLKLTEAFKGRAINSTEAKRKVDSLVKEIDRCIKLIEG